MNGLYWTNMTMSDGEILSGLIVLENVVNKKDIPRLLLKVCDIENPKVAKEIRTIEGEKITNLEELNDYGNWFFRRPKSENLSMSGPIKEIIDCNHETGEVTIVVTVSFKPKPASIIIKGG